MGFISKIFKKVSADGTKVDVINYENKEEEEWQPVTESGKYLEEMDEYIGRIFPCETVKPYVFHEVISNIVHIDVNIIPPDCGRDYYVLWTSGMSDLPMTMPKGSYNKNDYNRAELFLFLPVDWQIGEGGAETEDKYFWPIGWLKYLARFPHEYHTWLGVGHTIPNGADYEPLGEGTEMGGFFLLPVIGQGENCPPVPDMTCKDGTKINFLWAIPMYREEIEYKLEAGFEPMMDLLSEKQLPRVLNPVRENYKKKNL